MVLHRYVCYTIGGFIWSGIVDESPVQEFKRVANDWRGPQPRILSVVTVGQRRPLTALAIAALVSTIIVSAAGTVWFTYQLNRANPAILTPVMLAGPAGVAPKTASALPAGSHASQVQQPDNLVDISLPVSQLDMEQRQTDPAINIVATKLGDLPALREPGARPAISLSAEENAGGDLTERAVLAMQSGDSESAFALYEQMLATDPQNHDALAAEAYLLARSGDYEGAAKADRRLLKHYPRDTAARHNLIAALSQSAAPEAEEELYGMAASMPDDAGVQAALGRKMMANGDNDDALPYLDRAVRAAPYDLSYRLELAGLYDKLNLPVQALALYRSVLRAAADPDATVRLPFGLAGIQQRAIYLETQVSATGVR